VQQVLQLFLLSFGQWFHSGQLGIDHGVIAMWMVTGHVHDVLVCIYQDVEWVLFEMHGGFGFGCGDWFGSFGNGGGVLNGYCGDGVAHGSSSANR
jgi:hypothetical protein